MVEWMQKSKQPCAGQTFPRQPRKMQLLQCAGATVHLLSCSSPATACIAHCLLLLLLLLLLSMR
jgi:hypothetical protein